MPVVHYTAVGYASSEINLACTAIGYCSSDIDLAQPLGTLAVI